MEQSSCSAEEAMSCGANASHQKRRPLPDSAIAAAPVRPGSAKQRRPDPSTRLVSSPEPLKSTQLENLPILQLQPISHGRAEGIPIGRVKPSARVDQTRQRKNPPAVNREELHRIGADLQPSKVPPKLSIVSAADTMAATRSQGKNAPTIRGQRNAYGGGGRVYKAAAPKASPFRDDL
eukprot:SAG31_NODE_3077_length_4708_cov_5.626600_4_plen_178_part_00